MNQLSLFAGVAAFELAAEEVGIETILSCENDKYCCQVLREHFKDTEIYERDIRELEPAYIRDRYGTPDIIAAGFPCQSFSIAGKRQGFKDVTRGTLFFEIARLVDGLHPTYIILENVKGLFSDKNGWTFGVIISRLGELGYDVEWQLLNSKNFGVPQNRERVFIVGHFRGKRTRQIFPIRQNDFMVTKSRESSSLYKCDKEYYGCLQTEMRTDTEYLNFEGPKRRLIPIECERLQSFPDNWTKGQSDTQRYKQMGNSITVNVLREIYKKLVTNTMTAT